MYVSIQTVLLCATVVTIGIPLLLSFYYWRQALAVRLGEDLDGDIRNTPIGMQFVHHLRPTPWWKHVRWNFKSYLNVTGALLVISLLLGATAIIAPLAPKFGL